MSRRNVLLFVLLCALFGFAFVTIKTGLRYADPVFLIAIRFWGAVALLAALAAITRHSLRFEKSDVPGIVLLGLTNTGLVGLFLFLGQQHLSAGLGSILLYTYPLMAAGVSVAFLGESIDRRRAVGLACGFAGVVLIAGFAVHGSAVGIVLMLLAAASWAAGTVVFKRMLEGRDVLMVSTLSMLVGAVFLSVMSGVMEGVPNVEPTTGFWLSFLYLAGPGMAVPGLLWYYLLDQGEATVASAYLFLTPLFGTISGWLVLSEKVGWSQVAGGVLIAAGIYLVNRTAGDRTTSRRGREDGKRSPRGSAAAPPRTARAARTPRTSGPAR